MCLYPLPAKIDQGKYILTGNLTSEIFADDCRFVDPNNAVEGLAKYRQALALLFDPAEAWVSKRCDDVPARHIRAETLLMWMWEGELPGLARY